ncbi:helix-hairpin-helix domain-containing protein [Planococcus sp. 107-1]|uniref:helix-hairpin-helix domain-containing protein n=1 Tax=Planococcus sp. 107-1 TaxID=2908840 RepID=UPI001F18D72C|nr:helix-hairpin-helix domain-containing protein [Planococcus sp. 107-1]UJF28264.1 helix-hairpin-helix domain-containing protein [Planococcus sp. 107-1]
MKDKFGWLLIPAIAFAAAAIYFLAPQDDPEATLELTQTEPPPQIETPIESNPIPEVIMVDIKGQVANPGVYELQTGARAKDAIQAAGGFLETSETLSINLAMVIQDEMVLYVPEIGEEAAVPAIQAHQPAAAEAGSLVNLNTATAEELMTLNGIGPSKAEAILSYRTENGNFQSIEDLTKVSGIGDKTFEKLKEAITVN